MKYLSLLLLFIIAAACSTQTNNTTGQPAPEQLWHQVEGNWLGEMPCEHYDAVAWQLTLNADSSYSQQKIYVGKNHKTEADSGNWRLFADSSLTLYNDKNDEINLSFVGPYLQQNFLEPQPQSDGQKEFYRFYRSTSETNPNIYTQKAAAGIDFRATGNEPFWSLEIDFENKMQFEALDGFGITTPVADPMTANNEDTLRYEAETESGTLIITIVSQSCTNSMSGEKSDYQVDVQVKSSSDNSFKNYSGCGTYLGNYRVNGAWQLKRMGDSKIAEGNDQEIPTLHLSINQILVYGFSGCNRYTGKAEMNDDSLTFSYMASTRMACPGDTLEDRYLRILSEKSLHYRVNNHTLMLGSGEDLMVFEKVEGVEK
ncbi:MAG: META domain-containing protein [Clostridia bacterium]|nr:META domain-containing protein [Clostridia bacterium]